MVKKAVYLFAGVLIGMIVGGVAFAVIVNPPSSANRYYACVSSSGVVKPSTMKLNVEPASCPATTDVVQSWNAVGPSGPTGVTGAPGPTGMTGPGADVVRSTTIEVSGVPFNVPGSGVGPMLGPVDTSACKSATINWSGAPLNRATIYSVNPTTGDAAGRAVFDNVSFSARSVNQGHFYKGSGYYPANADEVGGTWPALTMLRLEATVSNYGGTVDRVWLDCIPYS
jgi:hypothetical protein